MFGELDSGKLSAFHFRNVIVSGIGVFSDSYNLYAIGLVFGAFPLASYLDMTTVESSLITGSSFFGAAIGAMLFGLLADRIGRKPMYGIDLVLIFIGAFSQLFVTNFSLLFTARLILGFGIGGDYVMSPVIMAENSNMRDRGKLMAVAFSMMYSLGATLSALVLEISSPLVAPQLAWKIVLAFGAVPSLFVIYYRRKIPETYRFTTRIRGKPISFGNGEAVSEPSLSPGKDNVAYLKRLGRSLPMILAGAVLWILYDTYSSTFTIYGPITIASNLGLSPVSFTYAAVFLAGIPGTIVSVFLIDRLGRRKLVVAGYTGVFVALLLFSLLQINPGIFGLPSGSISLGDLTGLAATLGFTFYLFNYLFSAMGPATIIGGTIIVPELIPTKIRASGQAINVTIDKLAVGFAITSFPLLLSALGLGFMVLVYAAIAVFSSIIMYRVIPETKGRTLEDISRENLEVQGPDYLAKGR